MDPSMFVIDGLDWLKT